MAQKKKSSFDATWLPFGMSLGTAAGIGTGLVIFDNLLAGVALGLALGTVLGIALGSSRRQETAVATRRPRIGSGSVCTARTRARARKRAPATTRRTTRTLPASNPPCQVHTIFITRN